MAGNTLRKSYLGAMAFALFASAAIAQDASIIWIDATPHDTCGSYVSIHKLFGNDVRGTYGADSGLGEFECPPVPPSTNAFWSPIPGRQSSTFGGPIRCGPDIRGWASTAQVDTFRLSFLDVCDSASSFSFRWPDSSYLALRCDSMHLFDTLGHPYIADMFKVDSLEVPIAYGLIGGQIIIVKYGARLADVVTDVSKRDQSAPLTFALCAAFPDPFNPSTQIQYSLPQPAEVVLTVYDILGREVETLVNGWKQPGRYTARWDASRYPTGTYYYRLHASSPHGGFTQVKRMILLK